MRLTSIGKVVLFAVGFLTAAGTRAWAIHSSSSQEAPAGTLAQQLDGPMLFRERGCAQCHEIRGAGGHKGPDLSGVGRRMKKDALQKQIVQGGGAMPAFGEVLAGDEVTTLVRYLQHCRDKTKPAKGGTVPAQASPPTQPE